MKTITVRYTVTQKDWFKREIEVPDDFDTKALILTRPEDKSDHELACAEIEGMLYDADGPAFNGDACYDKHHGQVECFIADIILVPDKA